MSVHYPPGVDRIESTNGVTAAFAAGLSPAAAARLLDARDRGTPWDELTRAVAAGLSAHFGAPGSSEVLPTRRQRSTIALVATGLLAYVLLRPLFGLGHELVVAGLAWTFHAVVSTMLWEPLVRWSGLDPIYAGAAIRAAGGVQPQGLAVGGLLGSVLHGLWPTVFLGADRLAEGAGISMVATPGAPALGRALAAFGADVIWLALGVWLFCRWRLRSWTVASIGLLVQAQIAVNHLLDAHIAVPDLEASGVPFALALAAPSNGWFTSALAAQPDAIRDVLIGSTVLLAGYACVGFMVGIWMLVARVRRGVLRSAASADQKPARPVARPALLVMAIAVATAASPVGALAVGVSNWQAALPVHRPTHSGGARWRALLHTPPQSGPTAVTIASSAAGAWTYAVDGQADVIRGVGYNPQYANLNRAERARLYQRDFGAMRELGINTIEGWFEGQFDDLTLDIAARNGIGIMMPFELNQDWPIENPNVQQSILDHVSEYVERYKNNPAVRMWAPGNENMHRILYPRWISKEGDPAARARADAFAAFLPVLVDRIHELDPNHPVVYRDAEDVYVARIKAAFDAGADPRPWLIYGANVYSTSRLKDIVAAWPAQWPGRALIVSEYAPGGVGPAERPIGFDQQWQVIRSRPGIVLGGLAYTWATNGPEDLDRVFGFVDAAGVPTDGALATLSAVYLTDIANASGGSISQ